MSILKKVKINNACHTMIKELMALTREDGSIRYFEEDTATCNDNMLNYRQKRG